MVYFQYNGFGFLAGHRYTFRWVTNNGCGLNFDEYGAVDFDAAGRGGNNRIQAKLEREYGRYFCCPDQCGGFSCWVSGVGSLTENTPVSIEVLEKDTNKTIVGASINFGEVICISQTDKICEFFAPPFVSILLTITHEDYQEFSGSVNVEDTPLKLKYYLTPKAAPPEKRYRCSGAPEYKCIEDPAGPFASLKECQAACAGPVPKGCEDVAWYDIPRGLHCVVKSLLDFPGRMWDFCFDKLTERWISQAAPGWTALEQRMDEASPGWREEFKKMGLSKSPVGPAALIALAGMMGFSAGFMGAPFMKAGATQAWSLFPWNVPGTSDLVRFQLREVFDPVLRAQQLIPPPGLEYYTHMRKNGFDQYWADSYWAAHWELPSVTQGYEMYHRLRPGRVKEELAFKREDLEALMKRQDVMPIYIPRLVETAYATLTRVDVRRMYALGVLDAAGVYEAYLDLGYSPADAARMRDFTVKFEAPEERRLKELSLGDMEKSVALGKLTDGEFTSWLKDMGYSDRAQRLELELAKIEREKKRVEKRAKELSLTDWEKLLYENKLLWSEIKARMIELGYSTRAQTDELKIVQLEATKKWRAAYLARTITLDELKKRLKTVELTDKEITDLITKLKL